MTTEIEPKLKKDGTPMAKPGGVMNIHTSDPLKAHSAVGAKGWQLETLPPKGEHPDNAVGLYRRGALKAFLLRRESGFVLQEVAHCEFCKK